MERQIIDQGFKQELDHPRKVMKSYHSPKLMEWGDLLRMTQGTAGAWIDGNFGSGPVDRPGSDAPIFPGP